MENRAPLDEDEIDRLARAEDRGGMEKSLDELTTTEEFQQAMDRLAQAALTDPRAAEALKIMQGEVTAAQKRIARRQSGHDLAGRLKRLLGR